MPRRWRLPVKPKLLVAAIIIGGAAGYLLFDLPPNSVEKLDQLAAQWEDYKRENWGSAGTSPTSDDAYSDQFNICFSPVRITCVVDGDTIWLRGQKIRIADINTPEISSPKCASEEALGHRAKDRLKEMLNAGSFQVVRSGSRDKDRYGRLLRVIMRDGESLGMKLVSEGLAHVWDGRRHPWC